MPDLIASGEPSLSIDLLEGANTIEVKVTAEDGTSIEVYALSITRGTVTSSAQQAYIKASNSGADDRFGYSLALAGDTLAIGAYREDSNSLGINNAAQANDGLDESGAAYLFKRNAGSWQQLSYIKGSNTGGDDFFGYSLAVTNDSLAVGGYGEGSNGFGINSGTQLNDSELIRGSLGEKARAINGLRSRLACRRIARPVLVVADSSAADRRHPQRGCSP